VSLKILITTLLLPIGLVLMCLCAALWALAKPRPGRGVWQQPKMALVWVCTGLCLLLVLSMPVVGRGLSLILVSNIEGRAPPMLGVGPDQADAILVLTGGMFNAGPIGWLPNQPSMQRLAVGYELQRLLGGRVPVIISGGYTAGVQNPSEARVVADFFARGGSQILPTELEESSTNTYENALQVAGILAKRQAFNVFLVTSDTHMLRSLATFRARGVDAVPFPVLDLPVQAGLRDFLPSIDGLSRSTTALYETYGLASYLISGKIGWSDIFYQGGGPVGEVLETPSQLEQPHELLAPPTQINVYEK
jgi:uncharacterized SAM-binding protein YcdF (DUF218 family)